MEPRSVRKIEVGGWRGGIGCMWGVGVGVWVVGGKGLGQGLDVGRTVLVGQS